MKSRLHRGFRHGLGLLWGLLLASPTILAQAEPAQSGADSRPEIASQIEHLTKSLEQTQIELAQSRTEIQQLRSALQEVLARMNAIAPAPTTAAAPNVAQGSAAARQDAPPQSTPEEGHAKPAQ